MQKRSVNSFLLFLLLSIIIFSLSKLNLLILPESLLSKASMTISSPAFWMSSIFTQLTEDSSKEELKNENLSLHKELLDQQKLVEENKALHDQFQTSTPRSLDLLPSNVLGAPRFIPGIFSPDNFVIDKGTKDKIKVGDAVVYKDNLIGKITKTSDFVSEVSLTTNSTLRFAAKTSSGVFGVIKGAGNGDIILDNVLLSDNLEKDQLVLTSGDLKFDQSGFLPDVIVGKITSIDKNPTDLFQRAKVKPLIDFSRISQVFIVRSLR